MFLVDNEKYSLCQILADDNGIYRNQGCPTNYFIFDGKNCTTVHKRDESFIIKKRVGRQYEEEVVDQKDVFILMRHYRRHSFHKNFMNLICRINRIGCKPEKYSLVINHWDAKSDNKENLSIPCHGNSRTPHATSRPFIGTEKNVAEKIKTALNEGKRPSEVYTELINSSGGPLKSKSTSEQPRNLKQVILMIVYKFSIPFCK